MFNHIIKFDIPGSINMLIEFSYISLSFLLTAYTIWCYFKRKERGLLYLTIGFTFLTSSTTLKMIKSLIWLYVTQINIIMLRLLELGDLALFACFTICIILALRGGYLIKLENKKK